MAVAAQQDDDLLIIADEGDTTQSDGEIDFSFDFGDSADEANQEAPVAETLEVETPVAEETKQEAVSTVVEESLDLGMSLDTESDATESVETQAVVEEVAQEEVLDEGFSFDIEAKDDLVAEEAVQEINETPLETPLVEVQAPTEESDSMNSILSGTIAKLTTRQDVISSDKTAKGVKVDELKAKIKELEAQVADLQSDMSDLDDEADKITANVSELEKMKLDPVKEHNAKRTKK